MLRCNMQKHLKFRFHCPKDAIEVAKLRRALGPAGSKNNVYYDLLDATKRWCLSTIKLKVVILEAGVSTCQSTFRCGLQEMILRQHDRPDPAFPFRGNVSRFFIPAYFLL